MKVIFNILIYGCMLCFPLVLFCETVKLKSGRVVEGEIISRNDEAVKIDYDGVVLTFYCDEIDSIIEDVEVLPESFVSEENDEKAEYLQKLADIKELLEVTNSVDISRQMAVIFTQQLTEVIRKANPHISAEMFDIISEEVDSVISKRENEYIDLVIKLYDKYYTHDDINALVGFYRTRIGIKTINIMPVIFQESIKIGQEWVQVLEPIIKERIIERFREKGEEISF